MERLRAIDLERTQLPKVWKGYDPTAVDALLKLAGDELARYSAEMEQLKTELYDTAAELRRRREQESLIADALKLAQQAAEDARQAAHKEADAIRAQAEAEVAALRLQSQRLRAELRAVLEVHLGMIEGQAREAA